MKYTVSILYIYLGKCNDAIEIIISTFRSNNNNIKKKSSKYFNLMLFEEKRGLIFHSNISLHMQLDTLRYVHNNRPSKLFQQIVFLSFVHYFCCCRCLSLCRIFVISYQYFDIFDNNSSGKSLPRIFIIMPRSYVTSNYAGNESHCCQVFSFFFSLFVLKI